MIKNLVFDWDGTLLNTTPVIVATMQATLKDMNLPFRTEAECRATIGLKLCDIPRKLFPDLDIDVQEFMDIYHSFFDKINVPGLAVPFDGVLDVLRGLRAKGYGMAIASSRSRDSLIEYVSRLGVTDCFDTIVAGSDVENGKPAPDTVLVILDRMGWKDLETMVIGDAGFDIQMGNAAGCTTCAVTYGNGTKEELAAANPSYTIDDIRLLPSLL